MLSKFTTKAVFQGFMALLVLVASLILPQQTVSSEPFSQLILSEQPTSHSIFSADDEGKPVAEPFDGNVDFHGRILTKLKIKSPAKKAQTSPAQDDRQWLPEFTTNTPSFSKPGSITRPAYYLFLFRYTLF